MTYSIRSQPGPASSVIAISGDADAAASAELDAAIAAAVDKAEDGDLVIIDLAEVNFMDSLTIGVLSTWQARIRVARGRMAVVGAGADMMRLFRAIGLEQTFEFFPTREAAAEAAG